MKYNSSTRKNNCTLFPEGGWTECCERHDKRYENKRLNRYQADKLLFRCVKRKSNVIIAGIMFAGVRTFGWYFYKKA